MKPTNSRIACSLFALNLAAVGLMTGCSAHDSGTSTAGKGIGLYKASGSRQCDPASGGKQPLTDAVRALSKSGVNVLEASCGHDGLMHVTLCGAETGELWIVSVTPESLDRALAQGFKPLQEVPQAQSVTCRD